MRRRGPNRLLALCLATALSVAACGSDQPGQDGSGEWAVPTDSAGGYPLASLWWYQEGRPVEFGGRQWQPVGQPLFEPTARMAPVGRFEGMRLFAPRDERPPYDALFFPIGPDLWQMLKPGGRSGTGSRER